MHDTDVKPAWVRVELSLLWIIITLNFSDSWQIYGKDFTIF